MLRPGWRGLFVVPLLATAGAAWAAHSVQTAQPPSSINVLAVQSIGEWSDRIARQLGDGVIYPRPFLDRNGVQDYHQGLAKVVFQCGDDGRPADVRILKSSGAYDLDRAAVMAVKRIATLRPLPDGLRTDRGFQAWILFSSDEQDYARQMDALRQEARMANAANLQDRSADKGPTVILASR